MSQKRLFIFFLFLLLSAFCPPPLSSAAWQELKGDHFIVYYNADEAFARNILYKAEKYYHQIADDLGYERYSNFWQWENRAKIYVYPSEKEFQDATGQPEWSEGAAIYSSRQVHVHAKLDNLMDGVLPHEIAHLIFRDFIGFRGEAPIWLDEGVAQWEEPRKREIANKVAKWLVSTDKDMALQDLMSTNPQKLASTEKVTYYYMQAVSVVDFMIRTFGARAFTDFCRALRDGKKFDEALKAGFGSVGTSWDLDQMWRRSLASQPEVEVEIYR